MTTFFTGGTAVILHVFDAENTLRAIERHSVDGFGQIPAMFQMQWLLPNFADYDLSSLRSSLFGGQQVSRPFVERLQRMTPLIGTGLGLTEMAGFVTYTGLTEDVDNLISGVGWSMPITPLSIRQPMTPDGKAGKELPDGETGEICFSGPQVFIDYVSNPEAYRQTVTSDGICYTGDLGYVTDHGLMFSGRSKLVIKPKGYQVHPGQIEQHFMALADDVASCAAVGQPHDIFGEAVVLFVSPKQGRDVSRDRLEEHAGRIAAYMRPTHYVILEGGVPLNRLAKTDYVLLKGQADEEIARLRSLGKWDVNK
jgi:acyl-CoA synthetase (AMP-forming)/AMP-acid ligase II